MKKIEILEKVIYVIVGLGICIIPFFVFLLVLLLTTGGAAVIGKYLEIDLTADIWAYIILFGGFALAGRTAIGTFRTYRYAYSNYKILIKTPKNYEGVV